MIFEVLICCSVVSLSSFHLMAQPTVSAGVISYSECPSSYCSVQHSVCFFTGYYDSA